MRKLHLRIWDKIRSGAREFWYFLSSKIFLLNFGKLLGISALLFLFLTLWMRCYTRHGNSVEVGNYVGMTFDDAVDQIEDDDFRYTITDSIFIVDEKPGLVLEQNPPAKAMVKGNRTIYLTITKRVADEVSLPGLVGNYDYNQYARKLKMMGMKCTVKKQVFSNKLEPNSILHFFYGDKKITENDLKDGMKIPMGAKLEFVVTTRAGGRVEVPKLICLSFSEAEFLITSSGLKIGKVIEDSTVSDRANSYVKSQFPINSMVSMNTRVEVQLTQDKPASCN